MRVERKREGEREGEREREREGEGESKMKKKTSLLLNRHLQIDGQTDKQTGRVLDN